MYAPGTDFLELDIPFARSKPISLHLCVWHRKSTHSISISSISKNPHSLLEKSAKKNTRDNDITFAFRTDIDENMMFMYIN